MFVDIHPEEVNYYSKDLEETFKKQYYLELAKNKSLPKVSFPLTSEDLRALRNYLINNFYSLDDLFVDSLTKLIEVNLYFYTENTNDLYLSKKYFEERIKESLDSENKTVQEVISILKESTNSCVVGGYLRDSLSGYVSKDIDFVTDIEYSRLVEMFKKKGFSVKEAGKQYLVIIVSKNGSSYEISNFRTDGEYKDGRRPVNVLPGTIFQDAKRRDFTVNAVYFNLHYERIYDVLGTGLKDIVNMKLKFIGKPKDRIEEDYLRVFRFYRFVGKGFKPEKRDLSVVRSLFDKSIKSTSSERIKNELERIVNL